MKLDIQKINDKYINEKVENILNEIDSLKQNKFELITIEELNRLSKEEINELLNKYNLTEEEKEESLRNIESYYTFKDSIIATEELKIYNLTKLNETLNSLNEKITDQKKEINKKVETLKEELNFYKELLKIFNKEQITDEKVYEDAIKLIMNSNLEDLAKIALSIKISQFLIEVSKHKQNETDRIIDEFENDITEIETETVERTKQRNKKRIEQLKKELENIISIERLNLAELVCEKYISVELPKEKKDWEENYYEYQELCNVSEINGYPQDAFNILLMIGIGHLIDKDLDDNDEKIKEYTEELHYLYELGFRHEHRQDIVSEKMKKIKALSEELRNNIGKLSQRAVQYNVELEEIGKLYEEKNKLDEKIPKGIEKLFNQIILLDEEAENNIAIIDSIIGLFEEQIYKCNEKMPKNTQISNYGKRKIKSIVLFHKEDNEYVIEKDLSNNSQLFENSINTEDTKNAKIITSDLIKELYLYGNPLYVIDTSNSNYKNKVLAEIYYKSKNGKPDRKKPTGMYRIRPKTTSYYRFAEKKVTIPAKGNTSEEIVLIDQLKSVIEKHMPNAEIDVNEEFNIYVNVAIGLKREEGSIYDEAIRRYDENKIKILNLLYKDGRYRKEDKNSHKCELKAKLNEEEMKELDKLIQETIEFYTKLSTQDDEYNLEFIKELTGEKSGGKSRG